MKTVRKDDADLRRRKWRFPVCCTSRKNVTAAECAKNRWDGRKHGALRRRDEPDRPAEEKGEFETMTQKDKQALLRVRSQARLVQELRERLEDTKAAIGAAALDGMPRGKGGLPRGLEMKVMLRETLEESLKREEKRLRDYEKEAREAMIGMKSGAYAFCLYYYICGMNLEDTARITDRCERQIRRYKREIEKGNEENGEAD